MVGGRAWESDGRMDGGKVDVRPGGCRWGRDGRR